MPTSSAPSDAGRAVPGARAGAADLDRRADRARSRPCARSLRRAGCGRCCRCRRRGASCAHASPMSRGAVSRSTAAEIAPGRTTRGARPVQSTTVEGSDGASVPPSSTRSAPRAIAALHCSRISRADIAGGTPGRFALVEVIASPCARISRCSAAVRRPADGDAALRTAQRLGHALLAAGQHERERAGPVARREVGREARQVAGRACASISLPAMSSRNGLPFGRPLSRISASTESRSIAPPNPYTVSVG